MPRRRGLFVGLQIAIAQAKEDEQNAIKWLSSRFDLLCLPSFTNSTQADPRPLGEHDVQEQVIFLAESVHAVKANWKACWPSGSEDQLQPHVYHLHPRALACIEWTRTCRTEDGSVVAGRYYLNTRATSVFSESQSNRFKIPETCIISEQERRRIKELMTSLTSWVRRTYPGKSVLPPPIHVGPAMWAQIAEGSARLVHGNGVTLVQLAK